MTNEFLLTIPEGEYHQATREGKYLSSHMLIDFLRNPQKYKAELDGEIVREETPAMALGSATHKLILEGKEAFDAVYDVTDGPLNPKTGEPYGKMTKAYRDWLAVQPKPVVCENDYALMENLQRSVWKHCGAAEILGQGVAEKVVRFQIGGIDCQARYDWLDLERGIIADLKTCEDLDNFARASVTYGYIEQMAFYRRGIVANGGKVDSVFLIAVEKAAPYRTGVFYVKPEALAYADSLIDNGVAALADCRNTGVWPTHYENVRTLDYPAYFYTKEA